MPDTKITALTAIGANPIIPSTFPIPMVDLTDTSMAASGTTKKVTVNQILGAGGTATLASATITGDLTVDTNVLKVDTTNNRVGIGTATPGFPLHVQSATAVFKLESSTGTNPAYLYTTSTGGDFYFGRDNSTGTTFGTGTGYSAVLYSANAYPMVFFTNAIERARITSSGDVNISTGNLVMGTSGKGIDFSATANSGGTMTSELLNDYEEGTWTPVVADASTGGNTGTCTINSAKYTKIGRLVSVQCDISGITTTGMTAGNTFFIRGLPFTSAQGGNGNFYTYRVGRDASTVSSSAFVVDSSSAIFFPIYTTNSATTDKSILVSDIVSTTSQIIVSVTYTV